MEALTWPKRCEVCEEEAPWVIFVAFNHQPTEEEEAKFPATFTCSTHLSVLIERSLKMEGTMEKWIVQTTHRLMHEAEIPHEHPEVMS